ncbi:uncharacterized protein [Rutidosis leptorrhynchoides]|uniref:uncharacterized protein n=1 Tax=Rutidosis leptorrhynchoides TaxID=125765 RepID=UPI003A9A4C1B
MSDGIENPHSFSVDYLAFHELEIHFVRIEQMQHGSPVEFTRDEFRLEWVCTFGKNKWSKRKISNSDEEEAKKTEIPSHTNMDVQDHTIPSGHESHHRVHLCHRCGWPFPNPHPSAKHRRSHKKVCGKVEGYTTLIGSEVISDDEHNPDDDKEKSPSPNIEKNTSISRSEEDLFADAVTEFTESEASAGSANKTVDDGDSNVVVNAPLETNNVDDIVKAYQDTDLEKNGETEITTVSDISESKLELTDKDAQCSNDLVKDVAAIEVMEAAEGKSQESQNYETVTEEAKDSEISKITPEVSETGVEYEDIIKGENLEKWESATADLMNEEIKQEIEAICENDSEVTKESETVDGVEKIHEEIKLEKVELDHEHTAKVAVLTEREPGQKVVEVADVGLTEKHDLGAVEVEKHLNGQIQEVVQEPDTVVTAKDDLEEPILEKGSTEKKNEVVEKLDSILAEMENFDAPESEICTEEQIQVAVKEPETVPFEEEDNKRNHEEIVEKPDSILTEKQDLGALNLEKSTEQSQPDSSLIEKEDAGAPKSDVCSKDNAQDVIQLKVGDLSNDVNEVSVETATPKDSSDNSVDNGKNASAVVPEAMIEEGNDKLLNNQESSVAVSVDSSSRNSLEGNWGSVSVLSTASIDAEALHLVDKSKVNSDKSTVATLVEPEGVDQKSRFSETQDSKQLPNSETLTQVNNESKKTEEVIAKVTKWSTGKQSIPLKNLLGDDKLPSVKQLEPVVQKDENEKKAGLTGETAVVNHDISSPPKLIDDVKKGRKKVRSWVPFVCCSSVNVVN